jgi:hypothetical protein
MVGAFQREGALSVRGIHKDGINVASMNGPKYLMGFIQFRL